MHQRVTFSTTAVAVIALLLSTFIIERASSPPSASASDTSTTVAGTTTTVAGTGTTVTSTSTTVAPNVPPSGFYIVIGGSASLGFQPNGVEHHNGTRTNEGYANDVEELEANNVTLNLRQVGCAGETVRSMLGLISDRCHMPITQLSRSVTALIAYGNEEGLVTIDLGFNDLRPCLLANGVEQFCVNQADNYVRQDLPKILKILKAAAGPNVRFVGLEYADPYLGYYRDGANGPAVAAETLTAMTRMNNTLAQAYAAAAIPIANVPGAYQSDNNSPDPLAHVGTVPKNVAIICQWTWMCTPPPFGPDDHPNNAGYEIIARSIISTLPTKW
jgi:lysophospholipase L1-like esterase